MLFESIRTKNWRIPVHCYNYVRNLPEMMCAADLLLTKAGGLTTSEALACGLPIIFVEAIRGQETGNVSYVCEHSAGAMAETPVEVQATLCTWLQNDQKVLRQFSRNARKLGKPDAAYQIAREVQETISAREKIYSEKGGMENRQIGSSVSDG
jgi:1,2-diacylglycerol 3-beta-galactosyltransferase